MTLTIHTKDSNQKTAVRLFLDALHIDYKTEDTGKDETEYLSSSNAMKEHLEKAANEEKEGKGQKTSLDDIWK